VFLWFAGASVAIAWTVFHDPALDNRLIVAGALLPDLVDGPFGGARAVHSVAAGVVMLVVVMLATRNRRRLRRHLLAIPIGMLLHLALDGMWTEKTVFWWPFFGWSFGGIRLPSVQHPGVVVVVEEAIGAVCLLWAWRRFRLFEPDRRARFIRTGYLGR
jgi:membrane-bound metal-dependent hydrolase YbcI (DUF457 family)